MKEKIKTTFFKLQDFFIPTHENNYRPRFLTGKFPVIILAALVFLKLTSFLIFSYLPPSVFFADISDCLLLDLTNQGRQVAGQGELKDNSLLKKAAILKARDMLEKGYFSHVSPDGKSPWYWIKKANYDYQYAGENLAIGFLDSMDVYRAWMNSPGHRSNIVNSKYTEIGIAAVAGKFQGNDVIVVVQMFASPRNSPVQTAAAAQPPRTTPPPEKIVQEPPASPTAVQGSASDKTPEKGKPVCYISSFAGTSDSQGQIDLPNADAGNKVLGFFAFNYQDAVKKVIYFFAAILSIVLLLTIFARIDIQHPDLVVKTALIIFLLLFLANLNKATGIAFIYPL